MYFPRVYIRTFRGNLSFYEMFNECLIVFNLNTGSVNFLREIMKYTNKGVTGGEGQEKTI